MISGSQLQIQTREFLRLQLLAAQPSRRSLKKKESPPAPPPNRPVGTAVASPEDFREVTDPGGRKWVPQCEDRAVGGSASGLLAQGEESLKELKTSSSVNTRRK